MGKDMKQVLVCRNCQAVLSRPVEAVTLSDAQISKFDFAGGGEITNTGTVFRTQKSFIEARYEFFKRRLGPTEADLSKHWLTILRRKLIESDDRRFIRENFECMAQAIEGKEGDEWSPKAYMLHFAPQDWINVEDMIGFETDQGLYEEWEDGCCCGPTGFFGLNYKCHCDEFIGTICLECNAPSVFIPDPEFTSWIGSK